MDLIKKNGLDQATIQGVKEPEDLLGKDKAEMVLQELRARFPDITDDEIGDLIIQIKEKRNAHSYPEVGKENVITTVINPTIQSMRASFEDRLNNSRQYVSEPTFQINYEYLLSQGIVFPDTGNKSKRFVQNLQGDQAEVALSFLKDQLQKTAGQAEIDIEILKGIHIKASFTPALETDFESTVDNPYIEMDIDTTLQLYQSFFDDWKEKNKPTELKDGFPVIRTLKEYHEGSHGSGVYLVKDGEKEYVYKPRDEQDSLMALNGPYVEIEGTTVPNRETAAYIVSNMSGFDLVPETKLSGNGSLQEFVQDAKEMIEADLEKIPVDKLIEIAVFIHIIGSRDTHYNNILIEDNKVHLIDNAFSFYDKRDNFYNNAAINQFVQGREITDSVLNKLSAVLENEPQIRRSLDSLLSQSEIDTFFIRVDDLIQSKVVPIPKMY